MSKKPTEIHNGRVYIDNKYVGILTAFEVEYPYQDVYYMDGFSKNIFTSKPTYRLTCWDDESQHEIIIDTGHVDLVKEEGVILELHVMAAHGFKKQYIAGGGTTWASSIYSGEIDNHQNQASASRLASHLPGVNEKVEHPLTKEITTVRYCIISLNDTYKWTREEIADWLETLDIDITFRSEDEPTG